MDFFDTETEEAFYCSQLAYRAYIRHGINLNSDYCIPLIPESKKIVFPVDIWDSCNNVKI
jgi:hypothetical protein